MKQSALLVTILVMGATSLFSQAVALEKKPSFEVASIKRNLSAREGGGGGPRGDRFVVTNVPVRTLLSIAFRPLNGNLLPQQIIGGPVWLGTDRFDVEAKMPGTYPAIPFEQVQLMVQSLLEDRFQLKARRETRELPVYELVVAKGGLKMKMSEDQAAPDPKQTFMTFATGDQEDTKPLPRGAMRLTTGSSDTFLSASAVQVSSLVNLLQGPADRIIIDKTNLPGLFDIHLRFFRDTTSTYDSPSLFTAIQELGLRLESGKAPLPVVVIDSAQKPTEN